MHRFTMLLTYPALPLAKFDTNVLIEEFYIKFGTFFPFEKLSSVRRHRLIDLSSPNKFFTFLTDHRIFKTFSHFAL